MKTIEEAEIVDALKSRIATLVEWIVSHCDCEERGLTCEDCKNKVCPMKVRKEVSE